MSSAEASPSGRWVVTGGCGFIGVNLVRRLHHDRACAVRVVDDLSVGSLERLRSVAPVRTVDGRAGEEPAPWPGGKPDPVELLVRDIREGGALSDFFEGADVVVHLAASTGVPQSVDDPRSDCTANVLGTLNCLEAARRAGVRRFVFASSGAPVGEVDPPIHEELAPRPVSPYGASKLAGEGYCSAYARTFGVETVALRFGNVYGPRSDHKTSVVAKFIRRALSGQPLEIYGDGEQTRDFIYMDDLLRAVELAATEEDVGGELFQIATAAETSVTELVDVLCEVLEGFGVGDVPVEHAAPRKGDVRRNFSDTSKARDLLGWQAEVDLREGLRRTVEWFAHREKEPGGVA